MSKRVFQRGVVSIIALSTLVVMLLLSVYFLSFALTENKISKTQGIGTKSYHLAEAGINQAIWKLKYDKTETDGDDPWATCFVESNGACGSCDTWAATFTKNTDELIPNSSVVVTIQNLNCGRGNITATSTINLSGEKKAQRVVKTSVFKSLVGPTGGAAIFSGGSSENIDISGSNIRVFGNIFCNNNLNLKFGSVLEINDSETTEEIEGKILVVKNLDISWTSQAIALAKCAKNMCETIETCGCEIEPEFFQECEAGMCRPEPNSVPLVDFDSESLTSFKSRAQFLEDSGQCEILCNGALCMCEGSPCAGGTKCVLDDEEFEDLLWAAGEDGTLTLNNPTNPGIFYITGSVEIRGGRRVEVYGSLIADSTINIGERYSWTNDGQKDEGFSQINIYRPNETAASGLLTKRKINFGLYSSFLPAEITGVIYANDEIRFVSLPDSFTVTGGIISRKLSFSSVWQWFNFSLDDEIILYGLGYKINGDVIDPIFSPIITVDHWEESY